MAFGFGFLRQSSFEFWNLSLPEFLAAVSQVTKTTDMTISSSRLRELMQLYPDLKIGGTHGNKPV